MTSFSTPADTSLPKIRLDQAALLRKRVRQSCITVECVILYFAGLFFFTASPLFTLYWLLASTGMVIVTYLYAILKAPDGITESNYQSYLRWHIVVSCMTGSVWALFACIYLDPTSVINMFVATNLIVSITLGGMLPSAEYRPSFLGLATCMLIPFAIYWIVTVEGPLRLVGAGVLVYYMFGLMMSARAEASTREGISGRKMVQLTELLAEQNKAIQKVSDEKTRFLAATSHDLSQPLHAQGFFIQSMRKTLSTSSQHDLLDKIEKTWRSQNRLLRGLLDISRLDSGSIVAKPRSFDLSARLHDTILEHSDAAAQKSIFLNVDKPPVNVVSDPTLLMRIVGNLLSNAIKFTPEGGRIDITIRDQDEFVELLIMDDGPGIPPDQHARVFDEYVQLAKKPRDRQDGLGLGLSIVRRLSDLLDVKIDLDSSKDAGTNWAIHIAKDALKSADTPPLDGQLRRLENNPLIVVIDDEPDIRQAMSLLMSGWGCVVIAVPSSVHAIEELSSHDAVPVLIIADKRLSNGMSGVDAINAVRDEVNQDIAAILMTGDVQGFDDVKSDPSIQLMPKPVDPVEIRYAVSNAVKY